MDRHVDFMLVRILEKYVSTLLCPFSSIDICKTCNFGDFRTFLPCSFSKKFRAPEEYEFKEENEMIDVYSMGIVFYSILTGDTPFEGEKESKAQKKVIAGKRPEIPNVILESEDIATQAILSATKKCWEQNPSDRPKASMIRDDLKTVMDKLKHEYLSRES